jgi:transcriptional regulator with PAS, ATPase and Fis domain
MRDTDIRVIAATNRNLSYEAANGTFREDLYHRLTEAILNMPPLRDRGGDIGLLATYLLNAANKKLATNNSYKTKTLSASARSMLIKHFWPGNVRELQNTILRAALWSQHDVLDKQAIEDAMLPTALENITDCNILNRQFKDGFDLEEVIAEVACHYLERAMKVTGGNKSKAAKMLNFNSYQCLDGWLKKYHVS